MVVTIHALCQTALPPALALRRRPAPHRRDENACLAVLHASDDLLLERGSGGVTIEGIAARAGVAKQTIYRWWPSKINIVLDTPTDDAGRQIVIADTGSAVENTRRHLRGLARFLAKVPARKVLFRGMRAWQHANSIASPIAPSSPSSQIGESTRAAKPSGTCRHPISR